MTILMKTLLASWHSRFRRRLSPKTCSAQEQNSKSKNCRWVHAHSAHSSQCLRTNLTSTASVKSRASNLVACSRRHAIKNVRAVMHLAIGTSNVFARFRADMRANDSKNEIPIRRSFVVVCLDIHPLNLFICWTCFRQAMNRPLLLLVCIAARLSSQHLCRNIFSKRAGARSHPAQAQKQLRTPHVHRSLHVNATFRKRIRSFSRR